MYQDRVWMYQDRVYTYQNVSKCHDSSARPPPAVFFALICLANMGELGLVGFGWVWLGLVGFGWVWLDLVEFGWVWLGLVGFG
jgi:hypothetical protein